LQSQATSTLVKQDDWTMILNHNEKLSVLFINLSIHFLTLGNISIPAKNNKSLRKNCQVGNALNIGNHLQKRYSVSARAILFSLFLSVVREAFYKL